MISKPLAPAAPSATRSARGPSPSLIYRLAPFVPYPAMLLGLFYFHSVWIAAMGYHLGMLVFLALDRDRLYRWALASRQHPWRVMAAVVGGATGGILLYLCWPLLGVSPEIGSDLARLGLTATTWPVFIIYFCAVNPWLEEWYWRGYLGTASRTLSGNDALFAGYHILVILPYVPWPWLVVSLLLLTGVGWGWRQEARLSGGLLTPMVSHALADLGVILAIYALVVR